MESLAFRLFVIGTVIFALCKKIFLLSYFRTVVVHSVVADSSLLDCCDLLVLLFLFVFGVFSTSCFQVGNRLGFCGGFSCFISFMWCQLFARLIRETIFRLPPAFVVCSFFLCHKHLCPVSFFHGFFCRRHSC